MSSLSNVFVVFIVIVCVWNRFKIMHIILLELDTTLPIYMKYFLERKKNILSLTINTRFVCSSPMNVLDFWWNVLSVSVYMMQSVSIKILSPHQNAWRMKWPTAIFYVIQFVEPIACDKSLNGILMLWIMWSFEMFILWNNITALTINAFGTQYEQF